MKLKFLECCSSDYFQGFGGETLAVPYSYPMTREKFIGELWKEWLNSFFPVVEEPTFEEFSSMVDAMEIVYEKEEEGPSCEDPSCEDCLEKFIYVGVIL